MDAIRFIASDLDAALLDGKSQPRIQEYKKMACGTPQAIFLYYE